MLGPELVVNGGFDTDTSGWTVYKGDWLSVDGEPDSGCVVMDEGNSSAYALQYIDVDPCNIYRFVYHFKSPDAGTGSLLAYPWIRFEDSGGNSVVGEFTYNEVTTTTTTYQVPTGSHLVVRANWQTHEIEVTGGAGTVKLRIQFAVSNPSEFRFDSFSLKQMIETTVSPACQEKLDMGYHLPGDLNNDCYVNLADLALLASNWLRCMEPGNLDCEQP